ncbi:MAG: MotA/TolQ/ExbB proton channel family protein [Desulfomonilia bacterium]|mgnify:FL=1|jgi:chemotaxis protein MotA|nr:MotA/TolQ/ExbB proton channel family protein [Deltaproteobacteria bacterium]MDX9761071.1 MotA/TolQ/ExbB proton channel family protein [Desulfomonilia bacterium]HPW68673.1 MotA/TolQ/ExbB proton channel family protein [Deltaproteobacteria bacterium]
MDIATVIGVVFAFGMVLMGIMSGGPLTLFVDVPSLLIVVGGTFGIIFIGYPLREVLGLAGVIKNVFFTQLRDAKGLIPTFVDYATRARREGILALESAANELEDPFFKQGLELVIDGLEPQSIREILETEIEHLEQRHNKGADILNGLGTYAPAMGMVGTLIGLVQMLQSMSDPSSIGPAMALALITTFYGSIMANMIALPMAGKLAMRSKEESLEKGMIIEGIMSISAGDNPRIVERKLHSYLSPSLREPSSGHRGE